MQSAAPEVDTPATVASLAPAPAQTTRQRQRRPRWLTQRSGRRAGGPRRVVQPGSLATSPRLEGVAVVVTLAMAGVWAMCFSYLAVVRHLAGGSHAEDLGFTDQVLWNFLHGQWFRMSIYDGATWNTELDV